MSVYNISLSFLQGTAGMCYGLLLSASCDSLITAMQACLGSFFPCLLLSGVLWPSEGMPPWLRAPAEWLPSTAACRAMRDVMSRGWSAQDRTEVWRGIYVSAGWVAVFLVLAIVVLRVRG